MRYEGQIYRPPCEARSLIIQVTIGCPWNRCAFCGMYKDKKFRVRDLEEVLADIDEAARHYREARSLFLADGNTIALATDDLVTILEHAYGAFPHLEHVGTYGGTRYINEKSPEELERLRAAGLSIVYLGLESGDDEVLRKMKKGVEVHETVQAGRALRAAGFPVSVYVLIGLGGMDRTREHAHHTAQAINAMEPHIVRPRTLYILEDTPLWHRRRRGEFTEVGPREALLEVRTLVDEIDVPVDLISDHITNYLPVHGRLPAQHTELLEAIDKVLGREDLSGLRPEHLTHL